MQFTLIQYLATSAKMLIGIWTLSHCQNSLDYPATQHTSSKDSLMPWTPGDTAKQRHTAGLRYSAKETLSVYGYFTEYTLLIAFEEGHVLDLAVSVHNILNAPTQTPWPGEHSQTDTSTPYIATSVIKMFNPPLEADILARARQTYLHTHTHTHTHTHKVNIDAFNMPFEGRHHD